MNLLGRMEEIIVNVVFQIYICIIYYSCEMYFNDKIMKKNEDCNGLFIKFM